MGQLVITVIGVLFVSALCSGTEAALFSVPLLRIRELANSNNASARALVAIREKMNRPITTLVILNNLANIGGSLLIGSLATAALGNRWLGGFSAALTLAVIVFAEIIPKTIGEQYAQTIALITARPVQFLTHLCFPLVWCLEHMMRPFMKSGNRLTTNEAEIKLLAHIGRKEGVIEEDESMMIHRVFELNDYTASDIMTPRVMMTSLNGRQSLGDAYEAIRSSQHTRIVVIEESPDAVLGIVLKAELLQAIIDGNADQPIAHFLHEALFVPETKRADTLLPFFREHRQHLAIAIDEYGGVAGVVTLEDVLEVLTGEIVDETDRVTDLQEAARRRYAHIRPLSEGTQRES
jgi:CBS domain containing-hemolysin-like protein